MRIYHPRPDTSVAYMDDISAKVNMRWFQDVIEIHHTRMHGGVCKHPMDEYTKFYGDLKDFVLHCRAECKPEHA